MRGAARKGGPYRDYFIRAHTYARTGILIHAFSALSATIVRPFPLVPVGNQIADYALSVHARLPSTWTRKTPVISSPDLGVFAVAVSRGCFVCFFLRGGRIT